MNTLKRFLLTASLLVALPCAAFAAEKPTPRVLLALYDSRLEESPRTTTIHNFFELPANHLGYDIEYHDIMKPLPPLDDNVAGVVLWFDVGTEVPEVVPYLEWLKKAIKEHKKLLILDNPGIDAAHLKDPKIMQEWNDILSYLGLHDDEGWNQVTYSADVSSIDHEMVGFERKITPPYPPVAGFHVVPNSKAVSHLRMHIGDATRDDNFDMVVTSPAGGFAAPGYAIFEDARMEDEKEKITQAWVINPFLFLKQAMNAGQEPVPDNTTLDGKRIFYAHVDGDGWNNISEIEKYNSNNAISAEVIYKEIIEPFSDFAFTVGVITADVEDSCFGVPTSAETAKKVFLLPNVEPASHTYSHPIYWNFFADYTPEKEQPLLKYYPPKPEDKFSAVAMTERKLFGFASKWEKKPQEAKKRAKHDADNFNPMVQGAAKQHTHKYKTTEEILKEIDYMPRSYACSPFDLHLEMYGSLKSAQDLAPAYKKARLVQWPGDTTPFEAAIAMSRKAGAYNINGGDSRFDDEFPSYSFVAPIGIQVGKERQIFSSNSNEETYTDDWSDRFYGFRYLQATVKNTENPIRVSPFNVYFHMFSGEKEASVNAIKENLEFARTQDIIPILASDYTAIAEGFYSTEIVKAGDHAWHIRKRGDLSTVRFDNSADMSVDFSASHGVLGQRLFHDSLYVALDPAVKEATVALHKAGQRQAGALYLVTSSWKISELERGDKSLEFTASGFGDGAMSWAAAVPGATYTIEVNTDNKTSKISAEADDNGQLNFTVKKIIPATYEAQSRIAIRLESTKRHGAHVPSMSVKETVPAAPEPTPDVQKVAPVVRKPESKPIAPPARKVNPEGLKPKKLHTESDAGEHNEKTPAPVIEQDDSDSAAEEMKNKPESQDPLAMHKSVPSPAASKSAPEKTDEEEKSNDPDASPFGVPSTPLASPTPAASGNSEASPFGAPSGANVSVPNVAVPSASGHDVELKNEPETKDPLALHSKGAAKPDSAAGEDTPAAGKDAKSDDDDAHDDDDTKDADRKKTGDTAQ